MNQLKIPKKWLSCLAAALLCLSSVTAASVHWGLSFQTPGQPPTIDVGREELTKYDAYYHDASGEKIIYLTFDAGFENGFTAKILDVLKRQNVPAAFFLVAHYMQSAPELTKRMTKEGHLIANHTYHHPDMTKITDKAAFTKEIRDLEALCLETTGQELSHYYRPPAGIYNLENLTFAQSMGYKTVFWSLAYVDWKQDAQPDPAKAKETVLGRTHPGAVVLLHSTSQTNADILEALIEEWKSMGYTFGTLDDLTQNKQ